MTDRRPFPPSPRRLALARASGLSAASPLLVGSGAAVAAIAVIYGVARAATGRLGDEIAIACRAADGSGANAAGVSSIASAVLDLAVPLLLAAAIAALVVHVAQTRSLWFPRRRIPGAPVLPRSSRVGFDMMSTLAIGGTAFGWLWLTAPRLAQLVELPSAAAAAIASVLVTFVIAWVAVGVLDAVLRRTQLARALAMTREEKREDDRLAAADPRWRAQRLVVMRGPAMSDAVSRATVVIVGDDVAVAIEWDAVRQPVPMRSVSGRGLRATQLTALARRHRVAVQGEAVLASFLLGDGPVPQEHWARLAEIVAAVRRR